MKTAELLATFLYKGYINYMKEEVSKTSDFGALLSIILNELNLAYFKDPLGSGGKVAKNLGKVG
jgi:hypothetical protein